jgi:hypothetical protein
MLKRPTVLILGAGAGVDIDMLVGEKLSAAIAEKLDIRFDANKLISGQPEVVASLRSYAKLQNAQFNEYRTAGVLIKKGVHYSRSIDSFINSHRHNEKLAICAKLGIIHTIFQYERGSAIYRKERRDAFRDEAKVRNSWLGDLFNLLIRDVYVEGNLSEVFTNLTIINFNYDRCIEQFFFYALCDWSQKSEDVIGGIVSKLRIYHPYGAVGDMPWKQGNLPKADFGGEEDDTRLDRFVGGIKTFHEQIEEADELRLIREILWRAKDIIFLGFHFHEQNMDLLQVVAERRQDVPRIYATVLGRSSTDASVIQGRIKKALGSDPGGDLMRVLATDCRALFKEYQAQW